MCGRYYISEEMQGELENLVKKLDERIRNAGPVRDVLPSASAPILMCREDRVIAEQSSWGYHTDFGKKLIINARAESVLEKKMFADSVEQKRCINPAAGFYEWDKSKNKYTFTRPDQEPIFMAGLYRKEESDKHFVILTTNANESMSSVHHRMPLILEKSSMLDWLRNREAVEPLLNSTPKQLQYYTENEQLRLELF